MNYKVIAPQKNIIGTITVPASKSIANRLLIIQALCNTKFQIHNISDSEDTHVLIKGLQNMGATIDIGHAGTSMRFLTAYFASRNGIKVLTGSERMKNRPIGNLVDALTQLGANIEYIDRQGYPPIHIKGKTLQGGTCAIDGSVSSQFISALLMVAPTFTHGVTLLLQNNVISSSYIDMTLRIMEYMGVTAQKSDGKIIVNPQQYVPRDITIEGDWSGVSYWYQIAALAKQAEITIPTLTQYSFQGDARCAEIFKPLGVETLYKPNGIVIKKSGIVTSRYNFNFIENPDLVQTIAVTCVMLKIPFVFEGTQSLRIKETDRIAALQNELAKFGAILNYNSNGTLSWNGALKPINANLIEIATYHDHRMALAFAPVALLNYPIIINDPMVVVKSYPNFWNDLKNVGFEITEIN